jgi:hypothetical protein
MDRFLFSNSHSSTTATAVVGFGRGSGTAGILGRASGAGGGAEGLLEDPRRDSAEASEGEGDNGSMEEQNRRGYGGGFP